MHLIEHDLARDHLRDLQSQADAVARARRLIAARRWARRAAACAPAGELPSVDVCVRSSPGRRGDADRSIVCCTAAPPLPQSSRPADGDPPTGGRGGSTAGGGRRRPRIPVSGFRGLEEDQLSY